MRNKVIKSIMPFVLIIVCMLAIPVVSVPAFAATITQPGGEGTTNMTYSVASTYTVTIPDTLSINPSTKQGTITVSVAENALIPYQTEINVELTTCDFELTNGDDDLTYTIKDGETPILINGVVHTHAAGTLTASSNELTVNVTDSAKYSGDYTDDITFTVSVDEVAPD